MMPFFPFIYEKNEEKRQEPLPLYVEEVLYDEPYEQQETQEEPRVIIIDIM